MKRNILASLLLCFTILAAIGCQEKEETGKGPNKPEDTPSAEGGDPITLEDFTVTLTSLHAGDTFLTIEPEDKDMTYWFSLQIKEEMPETDEEVYSADKAYFEYVAQAYGMSLSQMLEESLFHDDKEWMYNGLSPRTEYVLYMYGIDTEANSLTAVNRLTFTTPAVQPLDCSFDVVVGDNVTATSFSVTIVPSDDHVGYFYDVFPAAMYEEYCVSDPENIPAFIAEYIPSLASENGYTVPATVAAVSAYGSITDTFTSEDGIEPANTYYVFVVGLGADGTAVTDATVTAITTGRPPMNTFDLMQGSVEDDRASFYVTPTQRESYVALFELKEYMYDNNGNALTDDQIIDAILTAQGSYISNHIYSGTTSISECPLIPDKDYYCLVFGYFAGEVTTPLTKMEFRTKPADPNSSDIIVTVGTPTVNSVGVSFQPYLDPMPHMFNYMPYSVYEEYGADDNAVKRFNDDLIDSLWEPSKMSREEWLSRALETSYNSWTIDGLEPNTKYLVYAIGLVPDGTYTTAAFTKTFTTAELKEGPQVKEILFNKEGFGDTKDITAWFYFDLNSNVAKIEMSHLVDDSTIYDKTDQELLQYLAEDHETTFKWDITNQSYSTVLDKAISVGSTIYYAGAVYDSEGNYTIVRTTYTLK